MADFVGEATEVSLNGWTSGLTIGQVLALNNGIPASSDPISVAGIAQYAANAIDVGYTKEPFAFNPFATNDALNLGNYVVAPADRILQHAERVGPGVIRLYFDGPLTAGTTYTITVSNVAGDGLVLTAPFSGSDVAFAVSRLSTAQNSAEASQRRDIKNTGTLSLESTGDFANEDSIPYLRKRILRRATTVINGFALLPGYGFAEPLKSLITGDLQNRIASRARSQVLAEPDVISATVTVTATTTGILTVTIQATAETGTVDVAFRATLQDGSVQFGGA